MTPSRPVGRRLALGAGLVGAASVLAACSGDDPAAPADDHHAGGGPGAEPAVAPTPTVAPAGRVVPVGYSPRGSSSTPRAGCSPWASAGPTGWSCSTPPPWPSVERWPCPARCATSASPRAAGPCSWPTRPPTSSSRSTPRRSTRTTPVGHVPHDATGAAGGDILVGDEFGGSMSVVRDGRVVHTFDDLRQPGGVVADGRTALAVDVADWSVTSYDLDRMARVARVPAGEGPTHGILARPGLVAVADTRGDALLLFSVTPLRQVGSLALAGSPYGLAADERGGLVWVTLTALNEVVGVDVSGAAPREVARYPTVQQPNTVAVEPGSRTVWVASRTDGTVQRITR